MDLAWVENIAREAVPLAEALGDLQAHLVHFYLALALVKGGREEEGTELLEEVLQEEAFLPDVGLKARLVGVVVERGFVQLGTELAYRVLDEAERATEASLDVAEGLQKMADAFADISHASDAKRIYLVALEAARGLQEWSELAPTLLRNVAWQEHDLHLCDEALRRAFECWDVELTKEGQGYSVGGCRTQTLIAGILEEMGRFAEAEEAHKRALAIAKVLDDPEEVNASSNNYAVLLFFMGRFEEAHSILLTLDELRVPEEELDYTEPPVSNLAEVLFGMGQAEKAFAMNEKIIAALEDGDRRASFRQYMFHGDLLAALGRFEEADENYAIALDLIHERLNGNEKALGEVYVGIGRALAAQGRWEEAETELEKGCNLIDSVVGKSNARIGVGLRELARARHKNGKEAVEAARAALEACQAVLGSGRETTAARELLEELLEQE